MKTLNLKPKLFTDRLGTEPVMVNGRHADVRDYLLHLLDQPLKEEPMTRKLSKQLDRLFTALEGDPIQLEDADHEFLTKRLDKYGILVKSIYDTITNALDGASDA